MEAVRKNHKLLSKAWIKDDLKEIGVRLSALENDLISAALEITSTPGGCSPEDLKAVMNVLEIAILYNVCSTADGKTPIDISDKFMLYMSMLTHVYNMEESLSDHGSEWNDRRAEIYALYLLYLLTSNKISEFHAFFEQLSDNGEQSMSVDEKHKFRIDHAYIQFAHKLEQLLTEGRYNSIFNMINNPKVAPPKSFSIFIAMLTNTIRDEIASNMVAAYDQIPVADAQILLQLKTQAQLSNFVLSRRWTINDGYLIFFSEKEDLVADGKADNVSLATEELAMMSISYARELEQIV